MDWPHRKVESFYSYFNNNNKNNNNNSELGCKGRNMDFWEVESKKREVRSRYGRYGSAEYNGLDSLEGLLM